MNSVELPWPPIALNPNSKKHWQTKRVAAKKYKADCYMFSRVAGLLAPESEKIHVFIEFFQPDNRRRDQDNMIASTKYLLDGVAEAIGVDDVRFVLHPLFSDTRIKGGIIKIKITGSRD